MPQLAGRGNPAPLHYPGTHFSLSPYHSTILPVITILRMSDVPPPVFFPCISTIASLLGSHGALKAQFVCAEVETAMSAGPARTLFTNTWTNGPEAGPWHPNSISRLRTFPPPGRLRYSFGVSVIVFSVL